MIRKLRAEGKLRPVEVTPTLVTPVTSPQITLPELQPVSVKVQPVKVTIPQVATGSLSLINVQPGLSFLLAQSYAAEKDPRAVPLLDEYLAVIKDGTDDFTVSTTLIDIARLYRMVGQEDKARAAYQLVAKQEYAWARGVALFDQAGILIEKGQHAEARKLLQTPVEGRYAEQIRIGLLSLLSRSYYLTGDFEASKKYSAQALQQAGSLKLLKNEGLEAQVAGARQIERWATAWEKQPLVVLPPTLRVELKDITAKDATAKATSGAGESQSATLLGRLSLRAPRAVAVQVRSENPAIRATVVSDGPWSGQRELYYEQEVRVEWVAPGAAREMETKLVLSSPAWGEREITVPVQVRKASADEATAGTATAGTATAGTTTPGMTSRDKAVQGKQGKQDKPGPARE